VLADPLRDVDVLVDVVRLPGDNAVETDVGVRLENSGCERLDEYEPDPQCHVPQRRRRQGCSPWAAPGAAACGSAAGGLSVVEAAGWTRHSGRGGIM
jgi:hypothetical protein